MKNKIFFSFILILNSMYAAEEFALLVTTRRAIVSEGGSSDEEINPQPVPENPEPVQTIKERGRVKAVRKRKQAPVAQAVPVAQAAVVAADVGYVEIVPSGSLPSVAGK